VITDRELAQAVAEFWSGRQGGTQSAVHDKAFLRLIARDLDELGWPGHVAGYAGDPFALVPGYFRAAKSWDVVCRDADNAPRICVEFKSQVGSYGNNENNRYEEALGSGLDVRALHGKRVALGFFLVLCEEEGTTRPTRERALNLDPVFRGSSHVDRRGIFAKRITEFKVNDMPFYDAAAILLVHRDGTYRALDDIELDPKTFAERLATAAKRA
jgi:hypothetical protein